MELFYIKLTTGEELISKVDFVEVEYNDEIETEIYLEDPIYAKLFQDPSSGILKIGFFPWLDSSIISTNRVPLNQESIIFMTSDITDKIKNVYYTQIESYKAFMERNTSGIEEYYEEDEDENIDNRTIH